ncbi:MAG: laccase domain-containing protein [Chloroflexi bacterium]|nr:laccase domain-containing protein [Chloroflexota bacterium]
MRAGAAVRPPPGRGRAGARRLEGDRAAGRGCRGAGHDRRLRLPPGRPAGRNRPLHWPRSLRGRAGGDRAGAWAANRLALEQAGVGQIEVAGVCTACNVRDYFSHRAERGRTGRSGVVLALL